MEARTDTTKIDDRFHALETEMDERFEDMETRIANVESSVLQIQNMLLLLLQQSGSPVSRSPGSSLYGDSNDAVVDDDDKDSNDAMVDDDDKGSNDAVVDDDNKDSPKLSSDLVIPSFEEAGRLKFECLSNDGIDEHMIWLIGLKNIFAREIPSMPKQYIVRLVMDGIHKSVMVIRRNQVVGGITYRPYVNQKFGEIAFCAITADEQVKGYGTRLMNHLKQHARDSDGLTHFLTYADNNAVGFFIKQGFTKEIHLEKDRWQGYIKHYDGVLMEYKIDPNTSRF